MSWTKIKIWLFFLEFQFNYKFEYNLLNNLLFKRKKSFD
jgi:hypothetical protein